MIPMIAYRELAAGMPLHTLPGSTGTTTCECAMDSALIQEEFSDYILPEDVTSFWVAVDNLSLYIRRTDEGVAVDIYPVGMEMEDSIVGTWCLRSEAQERIEEYEHELEKE